MKKATPAQPKPYSFDIKLDNGTHTIEVDTTAQYGYFENNLNGSGGGLWFKDSALVDYDGVAVLPMKVIKALRAGGLTVSEDFE